MCFHVVNKKYVTGKEPRSGVFIDTDILAQIYSIHDTFSGPSRNLVYAWNLRKERVMHKVTTFTASSRLQQGRKYL